jgi:hypothetical protein
VNGTAGIGKSSFLLYTLARVRCTGSCAILHYRRTVTEDALVVFFPAGGGKPESLAKTDPGKYLETFKKWYRLVGEAESVI